MANRISFFKEWINRNSEITLIALLSLFFLTEAISKILIFSNLQKVELQAGFKSVVLSLLFTGLLIYKKRELLYIAILSIIFCIGQSTIENSFDISVVSYFLKYIFPIALFAFFTLHSITPKIKFLNFFEYVLIFNTVLIILGWIFEIRIFKTYAGPRFGYNGLLVTSSASTYVYIIGICYFLLRYQRKIILNWKFWIVALGGVIVGTKSVILALAALSVFYIIKYIRSKSLKLLLIFFSILIILSVGYYIFFVNPLFYKLRETNGIITSIFSLRDQLFMEWTLPYVDQYWGFWNYIFGGVSNFELRPQMEILDTLFFWGIIGGIAFGYFYFKSFFQDKIQGSTTIFILILILLIAFLAGNFLYNASIPIYLLILRETMRLTPENSS